MVQLAQLVRPAQRELLEQLAPLAQLVRTARLVLPDRQARLVLPAPLARLAPPVLPGLLAQQAQMVRRLLCVEYTHSLRAIPP